jgi:hypothetical protein
MGTVPSAFGFPFWAMKPTENVLLVIMLSVLFLCLCDQIEMRQISTLRRVAAKP